MKRIIQICLVTASVLSLSNCVSVRDRDHDRHNRHGGTTTTTTEETTVRRPYSNTVETQTTRSY